jgi:hypothetical protein
MTRFTIRDQTIANLNLHRAQLASSKSPGVDNLALRVGLASSKMPFIAYDFAKVTSLNSVYYTWTMLRCRPREGGVESSPYK